MSTKGSILSDVLWLLYHPLRQPARVLAQYEKAYAEVATTTTLIHAAAQTDAPPRRI